MLRPSVNQLITKNESSYSLVIGVAKRAREVATELSDAGMTLEEKPVKTAIRELAAGKYRIVEEDEEEPSVY
jgi:DNA-directed RNA polymerase subunit omega